MPTYVNMPNLSYDNLNPYGVDQGAELVEITPILNQGMVDGEQESLADGNIETFCYAKGLRVNWSLTENNLNLTDTNPDRYFRIMLLSPRTGEPDAALTLADISGSWLGVSGENDVVPFHSQFLKRGTRFSVLHDSGWRQLRYQETSNIQAGGVGQTLYAFKPQHGKIWLNMKNKKCWRPTRDLETMNTLIGIRPIYAYIVTNFATNTVVPDFKFTTAFYYKTNMS